MLRRQTSSYQLLRRSHDSQATHRAPEEVSFMTAYRAGRIAQPQVPVERITVSLIPAVADGLRRLQKRTNLSKTDLANRAITSYEFLDAQIQTGHDLIVRDRRTGKTQLVRFL